MTEIPEHLLKRSRERRAAASQGSDASVDAPSDPIANICDVGTITTAPATADAAPTASGPPARTAPPAPAAPPPPKPDPVYVQAARSRRKIPFWAMATLSLMPLWAFMYVRAVTEPPEVPEGPLAIGAERYSSCASCHGAEGGGVTGLGYQFSGGEVLKTFPRIEDQIRYVHYGTEGYNAAGVEIYGNPDREGGPHIAGQQGVMPQFGSQFTQYQIVAVVCHERYTLGGADPTSEEWAEEYETWCSAESPVFAELEAGTYDYTSPEVPDFGVTEIVPIGPEPVPGSAPPTD